MQKKLKEIEVGSSSLQHFDGCTSSKHCEATFGNKDPQFLVVQLTVSCDGNEVLLQVISAM